MPQEIERVFRVDLTRCFELSKANAVSLEQGYLCDDPSCTVRVRVAGEQGYLTIKGPTHGIERAEFEYRIPLEDAAEMLETMAQTRIHKRRYTVLHAGHSWSVDVFEGGLEGLVLAEVELERADAPLSLPDWVLDEISGDSRYFNARLAREGMPALK